MTQSKLLTPLGLAAVINLLRTTSDPATVYVASRIFAIILPQITQLQQQLKELRKEVLSKLPKGYDLKAETDDLMAMLDIAGLSVTALLENVENETVNGVSFIILDELASVGLCSECQRSHESFTHENETYGSINNL